MITIHWSRAAGHATFRGYRTHGEDPHHDMVRVLKDRGWPDDSVVVIDERGMRCWTIPSFHALARFRRPTVAERIGEREWRSWFPKVTVRP